MRRLTLIAAVGLCLGPAACDDPSDNGLDLDMMVPIDFEPPPVVDMRVDRFVGETGVPLGQIGDPCVSGSQCEQGYCVPYVQQEIDVCTGTCLNDDACPADWSCRILANSGADAVSVCTPPQSRVCRPCIDDRSCPGGHCYTLDGASVCGFDCESDDDCNTGYACADVDGRMTCTPVTGSCTCNDDAAGDARLCTRESEFGTCIGRETCDPEQGWIGCNAQEPVAEVCNQVDDDCNGFTDDIEGLGEVCERTVEVDGETIACSGRLVCTLEDEAPQCTAPAPMAELCNFLDDDCDGATDEGFEGRGQVCIVGEGACRRVGVNACSGDGLEVVCDVVPGDPVDELCNAVDDDCDGAIDEAFDGLNEPCFAGDGACRRAGALRCDAEGVGTVCTAVAAEPVDEVCDGLDNDCDGATDEGFDGLFEPCSTGVGACLRQGFRRCTEDGSAVACTAEAAEPGDEACNGIDDDCDGTTDEGFPGVNRPCAVGVGQCRGAGVTVCSDDGAEVVCNAEVAESVDETCDGLDNDCDGITDEDFDGINTACTVGVGACLRSGVTACSEDGSEVVCGAAPGAPGDETCNRFDDDCDGATDEDFDGVGALCTVGEGVCQRSGIGQCDVDGLGVSCDAVPGDPGDELCNGLDDDCDGDEDEGYAGLFDPCSVGVGACLRQGFRYCTDDGAGVACNATAAEPGDELCNGIDDDCDGTADEGFPGVNRPCAVGIGQCRGAGVTVCSADGAEVVCDAELSPPGDEVCDGLDNDCDGITDEGFDGINTACTVGIGACLRSGVTACSEDGAEVVCGATAGEPADETCNRFDDDCDGTIDEDYDGVGQPCTAGRGVCQRAGIGRCDADGAGVSCDAVAGEPADEACNGLDDDCDGITDEGFDGINTACSVGAGVCAAAGVRRCSEDGAAVVCDAAPGVGGEEICDGLDNDCDGTTDEGYPGLNEACSAGQGLCRRSGVTACSGDGRAVVCSAAPGEPADELCDSLDNDCDGAADEGYAGIGAPCSAGRGACLRQGVRVCADDGGAVVCNAEAGDPADDVCNGLDDDCDGAADEGFGDLNRACTVGQGVCRRVGVRVCAPDGAATVCDEEPGPSGDETCDGLDNDCDGATDEGYAGLGAQCATGVGLCRRNGVGVCSGDGSSVECDAVAGDPAPADRCDYQDDDCDGATDEDFVDGQGRYDRVSDCGACGTDCNALWDPDPASYGVVPRCAVGAVAQCAFDCLPGFVDADGRPGNGCEFTPDDGAVYVATPEDGGLAVGDCGAFDRPCDSVGDGIGRAVALARLRVRVAEGVYRESITLANGVDVLGGHDPVSWVREPAFNVTIINGASQGLDRRTVSAIGINQATTFDGFVVNGESPLADGNAYAIYVRDSNSALSITGNRIFAGDGGRGSDGASGGSGLPGTPGSGGRVSFGALDPDPCGPNPGGAGGARACGGVAVNGGAGGRAGCPALERQEGSGANGGGGNGGLGGAGAFGFAAPDQNTCTVSQNGSPDASPGRVGRAGNDGAGGAGAAAGVGQAGQDWRGRSGVAGVTGGPGGGGGGGGAAAGVDVDWAQRFGFIVAHDIGASGGGGGSGGCQGTAGGGGGAGGGSFGVYVVFSGGGPANAAAFPVIEGNEIARGLGGNGGAGGIGGGGGEGGDGGGGGLRGDPNDLFMGFCSLAAGDGAAGGRGGHGGGGGGGQGGISFDIFVANDNGRTPAGYGAANDFVVPAGQATHGVGGAGGNSSNTDIGLGQAGGDGISGNVGAAP